MQAKLLLGLLVLERESLRLRGLHVPQGLVRLELEVEVLEAHEDGVGRHARAGFDQDAFDATG